MKAFSSALVLLFVLGACGGENARDPAATGKQTPPAQPTATQDSSTAAPASSDSEGAELTSGVWAGQLKIDAHAGVGTLNYVGAESGDWVPMRFRLDSEVGKKFLAVCGDEDLCEFEGSVRFLDEVPPENASAVGEIVQVVRVRKSSPEAR